MKLLLTLLLLVNVIMLVSAFREFPPVPPRRAGKPSAKLSPRQICSLPAVRGGFSCNGKEAKWSYDMATSSCKSIEYGGCGATPNLFPTEDECKSFCGSFVDEK